MKAPVSTRPATATQGRRRPGTWRPSLRLARQITQAAALLLFLYLAVAATHPLGSPLPVELFLRLDPLLAGAASLAGGSLTSYALWALPLMLATLLLGRFFCGWICPLGTTLDLAAARRQRLSASADRTLRPVKYVLLGATLLAALLGNLSLLALDPLVLLTRTLATALLPALAMALGAIQKPLYDSGVLSPLALVMEDGLRGNLLPYEPRYMQQGIVMFTLLAALVVLNALAPRFWCRYLCPLGGGLGLLGRAGLLARRVQAGCSGCGRCVHACPMGATAEPDFQSRPGECIQCTRCRDLCAQESIAFRDTPRLPRYQPSRRQFLATVGASIAGVSLLRIDPGAAHADPMLVRPPGALAEGFLSRCVRCGECMKVCPTGALQPSLFQSGLEGLWSPVLVSRLGYCDWSCTACGQVCPTGAIAPLALDVKRRTYIGTAYIDQDRCLPWADLRPCIVCEEMCPLPQKAIVLDDVEVNRNDGQSVRIGRPRVLRQLCIGCGICEYRCPLPNEAAIRIYSTSRFLIEGSYS